MISSENYISIYNEDYLRYVIRSKFSPYLDSDFVFEPFIPQYFENWAVFKLFLTEISLKNSEFLDMVKYFEEFEKSGYQQFSADPIPKWIEIDENGNSTMKHFKDQTYANFVNEMRAKYNV